MAICWFDKTWPRLVALTSSAVREGQRSFDRSRQRAHSCRRSRSRASASAPPSEREMRRFPCVDGAVARPHHCHRSTFQARQTGKRTGANAADCRVGGNNACSRSPEFAMQWPLLAFQHRGQGTSLIYLNVDKMSFRMQWMAIPKNECLTTGRRRRPSLKQKPLLDERVQRSRRPLRL